MVKVLIALIQWVVIFLTRNFFCHKEIFSFFEVYCLAKFTTVLINWSFGILWLSFSILGLRNDRLRWHITEVMKMSIITARNQFFNNRLLNKRIHAKAVRIRDLNWILLFLVGNLHAVRRIVHQPRFILYLFYVFDWIIHSLTKRMDFVFVFILHKLITLSTLTYHNAILLRSNRTICRIYKL